MQAVAFVVVILGLVAQGVSALNVRLSLGDARGTTSCAELQNRGTHFTIKVGVGTPPQEFDPVVDTGSSNVIIPSCLCAQLTGTCSPSDDCFVGTNRSSTFVGPKNLSQLVKLVFGSGPVYAAIASDLVQLGQPPVDAFMRGGLLLMVRRELRVAGPFEGILGLGLPAINKSSFPINRSGFATPPHFLQQANVARFSICFHDGSRPGVLLLEPPPAPRMLKQVGHAHWGLDLQRISVGSDSAPASVSICPGRNSSAPCVVVLDSGTTLILGPKSQIAELFGEICRAWPRCSAAASEGRFPTRNPSDVFQLLLMQCWSWLTSSEGLHEVPSIFFKMAGATGEEEVVEITGWAYITESLRSEAGNATKYLQGILPPNALQLAASSGAFKICTPALGSMEFSSAAMPTWILGTPLFYEHRVVFGLGPPSVVGFERGSCPNGCADNTTALIAGHGAGMLPKQPRRMHGQIRVPYFDPGQPL